MDSDGNPVLRILTDRLQGKLPSEAAMFVAISRELARSGQADEADAMLASLTQRFPDEQQAWAEHAEAAARRADWPEALRRWQEMRQRFPDDVQTVVGPVRALREMGRVDEAEALFQAASAQSPVEAGALVSWADAAMRKRDWAEALQRWEEVKRRLPNAVFGYAGCARATRDMGQPEEADALFSAAAARFPDSIGLAGDWANSAAELGNWDEAERRWEVVAARFPDRLHGHAGLARLKLERGRLAEADALFGKLIARFPNDAGVHVDWAECATRQRDFEAARRRWLEVKSRFLNSAHAYLGLANCLRELGQTDEADAVYVAAAERFPDDVGLLRQWAGSASRRRQFDEAERRWAVVSERLPTHPAGLLGRAQSALDAGRREAAQALFEEAKARFPGDALAWMGWAESADEGADLPEALRRWELVRERFPRRFEGFTRPGDLLRRVDRFDDAEALLAEARRRFPQNKVVLFRSAMVAEPRTDWAGAVAYYAALHELSPMDRLALYGHIRALVRLGEPARAAAVVEDGLKQFPGDAVLRCVSAELALERGEHARAAAEWRAIKHEALDEPHVKERLHRLRVRFLDFGIDPESNAAPVASGGLSMYWRSCPVREPRRRARRLQFGLIQRHHGAEPLGLLRWASMRPPELIAALDSDFAGVGNTEQTRLETFRGEYMTQDRRFGMRMHTFVYDNETPRDVMLRRVTTRLKFLRSKMLEDRPSPRRSSCTSSASRRCRTRPAWRCTTR